MFSILFIVFVFFFCEFFVDEGGFIVGQDEVVKGCEFVFKGDNVYVNIEFVESSFDFFKFSVLDVLRDDDCVGVVGGEYFNYF